MTKQPYRRRPPLRRCGLCGAMFHAWSPGTMCGRCRAEDRRLEAPTLGELVRAERMKRAAETGLPFEERRTEGLRDIPY